MRALAVLLLCASLWACGGDGSVPSACRALEYTCSTGMVSVDRDGVPRAGRAIGVAGDVVLRNDRVTAVLDALETPHLLAPTGGTLIDLIPAGGVDELNSLYQVAGVLPDDGRTLGSSLS